MSLRPPSTSPSPSPGPQQNSNSSSRASLQPQPRGAAAAAAGLAPIATRQNFTPGARPTSELLSVGSAAFQNTPESEAIDQWFENLQNYEATLEEMAAASLDLNFKEELSAIEQWFRVLSEAERTAALYSLLQHSTQVQIRFFITVLQQMARSDPMTALLSPAVGSSMQAQMEAKLANLGLKSPALPSSPSIRNSFGVSTPPASGSARDPSSFLSPDSAQKGAGSSSATNGSNEAAAALAHQRAKLKASNASNRLSAPGPLLSESGRPTSLWTQSTLTQVAERAPSPATSDLSPAPQSNVRPKSTDFTGLANQFARSPNPSVNVSADDGTTGADLDITELRLNEQLSPIAGGNWASMVNTPLVPMFTEGSALGSTARGDALEAAASKLANWSMGGGTSSRVVLDDAKKFRRESKGNPTSLSTSNSSRLGNSPNSTTKSLAGEDGNLAPPSSRSGTRTNGASGSSSWRAGSRSPASSTRFAAGSDAGSTAGSNFGSVVGSAVSPGMGLGMGMGNFPYGMGMANMQNMQNMAALQGMAGMSPMQPNGLESQLMALGGAFSPAMNGGFPNAAAMGAMGNFGMGVGMGMGMGMGMGVQGQPGGPASRSVRGGRGGGPSGAAAAGGRQFNKQARPAAKPKVQLKDDDITLTLLNDVPAWFHILRLHKYTPVVGNKTWKELVIMNDSELENIGVTALGARRKLLKHFVVVRNKFNIPHPEGAETGDASDDEDGQGGDEQA